MIFILFILGFGDHSGCYSMSIFWKSLFATVSLVASNMFFA